jgi:hypothetical protein
MTAEHRKNTDSLLDVSKEIGLEVNKGKLRMGYVHASPPYCRTKSSYKVG